MTEPIAADICGAPGCTLCFPAPAPSYPTGIVPKVDHRSSVKEKWEAANPAFIITPGPVGHGPLDIKASNPKDSLGDRKVPLWLCSPIATAQWAVCQFVGLVKYGAWNWRIAGVRSSVYLSAMKRHMDAYLSGEEFDPKDQTPHLGHIMACAAILIDAKAAGKLIDDRPPSVNLRAAYAAVEAQMDLARENYGDMTPRHYTIADTQ